MARVRLFGTTFDPLSLDEACTRVLEWTKERPRRTRIVITPNVDHVVRLSERPELIAIYDAADMVLADGQPIVWASRWLGKPVPERVAGSDLFPALMQGARHLGTRTRVFLLGGAEGVADLGAKRLEADCPWVEVVGTHCPPLGFEEDERANAAAVEAVGRADADLVLVGLGAPKQEKWTHRERARLKCGVALCIGATVDFVADPGLRAPPWMRRAGLEWTHRLATDPRRLARRYAKNLWVFPRLVAAEALRRVSPGT